jgi:putative ABC transport system substrate-binding protein
LQANRRLITALAAKHRPPAIYRLTEFIETGGLMAYGPGDPDFHRSAATYVGNIFNRAKPGDLPIEQPTTFELIVNLEPSKALGLAISQSLLPRADGVVQ